MHSAVHRLRPFCSAVLCCAALRCAVPCCDVLCCAVLCCAVLCCAVLCCAVLCCAVLYCAVPSDCGCVQTCLRKFSIAYWRTPEYNCIRALVTVSMGFVLGTLYWKVGHHRYVYPLVFYLFLKTPSGWFASSCLCFLHAEIHCHTSVHSSSGIPLERACWDHIICLHCVKTQPCLVLQPAGITSFVCIT